MNFGEELMMSTFIPMFVFIVRLAVIDSLDEPAEIIVMLCNDTR
jgi:hypothetical protein